MKKAWKKASKDRGDHVPLPENWTKKIFMVTKDTYIIGDHRKITWTSFINSHNSYHLTHASIDGSRGIIKFHETVYGFDEVFLNYGVHISMSEHQSMNQKKSSGDVLGDDDEGEMRSRKRLTTTPPPPKPQLLSASLLPMVTKSTSNEVKGLVQNLSFTNYVPEKNWSFLLPEESAKLK